MKKNPKNNERPEQLEDHQLLVDSLRINCAYSNSILRMDINNGRNEWYDNIVQSYIEQDGVSDLKPKTAVSDLLAISGILKELATAFDHARMHIQKENGMTEDPEDVAREASDAMFRHIMDHIDPKNAHDQGGWASVNLGEIAKETETAARKILQELTHYHSRCVDYKKQHGGFPE